MLASAAQIISESSAGTKVLSAVTASFSMASILEFLNPLAAFVGLIASIILTLSVTQYNRKKSRLTDLEIRDFERRLGEAEDE